MFDAAVPPAAGSARTGVRVITAVTGLNGAGKTAFAVGILDRYRRRGIRTAANIGVEGAELVTSFEQMMSLRDCVLLVDEVTAVASSRQAMSLTPEALLFFQTLRHANVGCVYTCPTIERADIALRSLTLKWVALSPLVTTMPRGGIWRNTRVSLVRSGRPQEGAEGAGVGMVHPWFSLYRPAAHYANYDSYADVDLFNRATKFPTRCPRCGVGVTYGTRPVSLERVEGGAALEADYYCGTCGDRLGGVRPALQLHDDRVLTNPGASPAAVEMLASWADIPGAERAA